MEDNNNLKSKIDLTSFVKATERMIATNDKAYSGIGFGDSMRNRLMRLREYSPEDIARIIESGSLTDQQKLSRNYFYKDGYYKQIIIYYATLLKYAGLLIPNPSIGKSLSAAHILKRYHNALDFVDKMNLPILFTNCAQQALVDGCYYGVRIASSKDGFTLIDLPAQYCCSRFKDANGNDLIEFNLTYFDSIVDSENRKAALAAYPKEIANAYKKYKKAKSGYSQWYMIPSSLGVCFPFFDGRPLFLSVIPKTIEYDEAVETERERDNEEIRKVLVQKIPHLNDGRLLFEPDEAEEIHKGSVGMLKGNKNISVLTTYADTEMLSSKTAADNTDDILTRIESNIYAQAGVSGQVFSSASNATLTASLNNDLALMMYLANKFSAFITNLLNELFGNSNISFKYNILPITYYNTNDFVDSSFKLASSGYSLLLPSIAMGIGQKDLCSLKDLENDVLKLDTKLRPPATSYTGGQQTEQKANDSEAPTDEGGRPQKDDSEKADQTIKNDNVQG